ncbi:MAG: hypothetical protein WD772_04040 [Pseudohongiellaceae bacterium]
MTEVWGDPSTWTQAQWLAVVIMMFVIVASIVLVLRLYSILRMAGKPKYKPNLRRLRGHHKSAPRIDIPPDEDSDL